MFKAIRDFFDRRRIAREAAREPRDNWLATERDRGLWSLGYMTRDAAIAKIRANGASIIGVDDRNKVIFYEMSGPVDSRSFYGS